MKLTIIGGGSYTWIHTLIADLCFCPYLPDGKIVLYDINENNLEEVSQLAMKINSDLGAKFKVSATTDRQRALEGADYVAVSISTGGLDAMRNDLEISAKYGIWHSVGDTVGPGGISRAWRNVPVFMDIAAAMERYCPDAWMLNLTNPMTVLTRTVAMTSSIKVVGLCHELYHTLQRIGRLLETENWREDFQIRCTGINHFLWITELNYKGKDGLKLLSEAIDDADRLKKLDNFGKNISSTDIGTKTSMADINKLKFELFRQYGALPACGDRHLAEFLPWVLTDKTAKGADWGIRLTSIEQRYKMLADCKRDVGQMLSGEKPIPDTPSIESFAYIIAALSGNHQMTDVLNRPNRGQVSNLPEDAVLEGEVMISKNRIDPIVYGKIPEPIAALITPIVLEQEMTVKACVERDAELAFQALITDPMINDYNVARSMWQELLDANRPFSGVKE